MWTRGSEATCAMFWLRTSVCPEQICICTPTLIRICYLVCRAFGGDLLIRVYCDVVKPHVNTEELLLEQGQ